MSGFRCACGAPAHAVLRQLPAPGLCARVRRCEAGHEFTTIEVEHAMLGELVECLDEFNVTVSEAASELRVTRKTLYKWIERGHVPALRHGRIWLMRRRDLHQFRRRDSARPLRQDAQPS